MKGRSLMKDTIIIIILTFIAVVLTGCSSGEKHDKQPSMECEVITADDGSNIVRKSGEEHSSFTIDEGEVGEIAVSVRRVSGVLNITIGSDGKAAIYEGNDVPTSEFTVYAKENGEYTICVKAEDFVGDYSFNISKKSA